MGQAPAADNVVQISEGLRSQATLRERERRFRELLGALPAAVYTTDAAGRITYYNDAAAHLWGHRPPLGTSEWCGSWKLYWPDGTPLAHAECPMAIALKEDRVVRGMEAIAERPDGTRVPFIPYPTPIHDEAGKLVGAVNMLIDISERKRFEDSLAKRRDEQAALYKFTDRLFRAAASRRMGLSPKNTSAPPSRTLLMPSS